MWSRRRKPPATGSCSRRGSPAASERSRQPLANKHLRTAALILAPRPRAGDTRHTMLASPLRVGLLNLWCFGGSRIRARQAKVVADASAPAPDTWGRRRDPRESPRRKAGPRPAESLVSSKRLRQPTACPSRRHRGCTATRRSPLLGRTARYLQRPPRAGKEHRAGGSARFVFGGSRLVPSDTARVPTACWCPVGGIGAADDGVVTLLPALRLPCGGVPNSP
jgi:hypothetical protein